VGRGRRHRHDRRRRGAIYYQTALEMFADLNHVAALFEWDIDENGAGSAKNLGVEVAPSSTGV